MVKCPYCGAEIDYLLYYQKDCRRYIFDGSSYVEDEVSECYDMDYACPCCDESIASDEIEARKFLKEGKLDE